MKKISLLIHLLVIILLITGIGAAAYFYTDSGKVTEHPQELSESDWQICTLPPDPQREQYIKETMQDMKFIHLQLEKHKQLNGTYPSGDWQEVRELIGVEVTDKWGAEYYYETCGDQNHYALISSGADRTFKRGTWIMQGNFQDPNEDLFLQNGTWLRFWSNNAPLLLVHTQKTVFDELNKK